MLSRWCCRLFQRRKAIKTLSFDGYQGFLRRIVATLGASISGYSLNTRSTCAHLNSSAHSALEMAYGKVLPYLRLLYYEFETRQYR